MSYFFVKRFFCLRPTTITARLEACMKAAISSLAEPLKASIERVPLGRGGAALRPFGS
jgi:hypothetical protein